MSKRRIPALPLSIFVLAALLPAALLLAACGSGPQTPQPVPITVVVRTPTPAAAPAPTQQPAAPAASPAVSPLAAPSPFESPLPIPATPPAGAGGAIGTVQRLNKTPIRQITLYAGPIDTTSGIKLASIDPASDPHTESDTAGHFQFTALKPGQYALGARLPQGQIVLLQTADGKPIQWEVKAGQVAALGTLVVQWDFPD